ncbi:MAG TPA: hypothetical protein VNW92_07945 [Polyangiaceae bacterium]|jgi:hypothetical protein|nr:hypothetical protein [Polyangiaceae bacterium]
MKRCLFLSAAALIAIGCNHDKASDATPAASAVPVASMAAALPASAAAPAATDSAPLSPAVVAAIPAEEDFEAQAATTITPANASQQLAALEKELAAK